MNILLTILGAWLLADFLTGIVHWAQDKLLLTESRFKILNSIKADNDLHHSKPAAMVQYSVWQNINTSVPWAWPLALVLALVGAPTIIWLAVFFASFGNAVHRYAHMPKRKVKQPIRFLQKTGLFITFEHHNGHHYDANGVIKKEESQIRFCPMTNWLNPILDKIKFFPFLEYFFYRKWRL